MATKLSRGEISKMISAIENREVTALKNLGKLFSKDVLRRTFCFTGPAGVGKSTLISKLLPIEARQRSVAWLACDPSSPESGGSLLGDRIRISGSEISERIFIRSLSTRSTSAFSQSIRDIEIYLETLFDRVWVETAGSGQTQSEVARLSSVTVLILQPETGDEIQWMKSGVREWADLFVIHKCDLPGADLMEQSLIEMGAPADSVFKVSSKTGKGLEALLQGMEKFREDLNWKTRGPLLHTELARALFTEQALRKVSKDFLRKKSALLKNPYVSKV